MVTGKYSLCEKGRPSEGRPFFINQIRYLSILVLISISCSQDILTDISMGPFEATYSMQDIAVKECFQGPLYMGEIENRQITEASGLAVSRSFGGSLWTHNNQGDHNRVFLIGSDGSDRSTFRIRNTGNRDWEDMAIGPGPDRTMNYLYIADIGDNRQVHDIKSIYRFKEPERIDPELRVQWIDGEDVIRFRYPDGMKDAETVMIDPLTRDLLVVSKSSFPTSVYIARYPQNTEEIFEIELLGTLPFTGATGGDISPDGRNITIKTKEIVYNWTRNNQEQIRDAFIRLPSRLPYIPEVQGEAIAWNEEGTAYYTLSESKGIIPVLYKYEKKADTNCSEP